MKLKHVGRTWELVEDNYIAKFNDRTILCTWQFGNIYQCKIFVEYKFASRICEFSKEPAVGIGFTYQETRAKAMEYLVRCAGSFWSAGLPTVDEHFKDCFTDFPNLFKTRLDVIDHTFFVVGNGYDWLDGTIVSKNEDESLVDEEGNKIDLYEVIDAFREAERLIARENNDTSSLEVYENSRSREKNLSSKEVALYPVSPGHSLITRIPDDIRPDWLNLAYEAAHLLCDSPIDLKDDNGHNPQIGKEVMKYIEAKFPEMKTRRL